MNVVVAVAEAVKVLVAVAAAGNVLVAVAAKIVPLVVPMFVLSRILVAIVSSRRYARRILVSRSGTACMKIRRKWKFCLCLDFLGDVVVDEDLNFEASKLVSVVGWVGK